MSQSSSLLLFHQTLLCWISDLESIHNPRILKFGPQIPSSQLCFLTCALGGFLLLQVEGINRLIRVMQEVRDNGSAQEAQRQPGNLPVLTPEVQEAITMLQWFVREVQSLSTYARTEALRYY